MKTLGLKLLITAAMAVPVLSDIAAEFPGTPWNDQDWVEKKITITNTSSVPQYITGLRFSTPERVWNGSSESSVTTLNSSSPYRVQMDLKNTEVNFSGNDELTFGVFGSPGGRDGTPSEPSFLITNGSHYWPMEIPYAEPVSVDQLDSLMATADFYNESLAILDTLGQRGGPKNGGMIDTWFGLTQLQSALPTKPFNQNATWMTFEPKAYGNALYMMTLAAMQEYLNIDMQVLIAKGGKENMAGMVQWDSDASGPTTKMGPIYGTGNNGLSNVDFSPFSVEYQTFNDYVFNSYPSYFPLGNSTGTNDYYSTTSGSGGFCSLDQPNVVNGTMIACLYNWFTYQIGLHATDYGFNELFTEGSDPQGPLKLALWAFNRGITCGWERTVATDAAFAYDRIEEYPSIADNGRIYIEGIVQALTPIVEAARNSVNLGGTEPIYDDTISLNLIEGFLFGSDGSGASGDRGEGGLLVHFDLTPEQMIQLWDDVQISFDKMKGQAPSTLDQPEMISYRYDFLTMLRVIKNYLNTDIPLPTTYKYVSWESSKSSGSTTFGGEVRDEIFPVMNIIDTAHEGSLSFTVHVEDNGEIRSVEWSLDPDLVEWGLGIKVSDVWELSISDEILREKGMGDSVTVRVRVTDTWGNAELRQLTVLHTKSDVSIETVVMKQDLQMTTGTGNSVILANGIRGSMLSLYTLRGRQVYSGEVAEANTTVNIPHLTAGIYLATLTLPNGAKVSQQLMLK